MLLTFCLRNRSPGLALRAATSASPVYIQSDQLLWNTGPLHHCKYANLLTTPLPCVYIMSSAFLLPFWGGFFYLILNVRGFTTGHWTITGLLGQRLPKIRSVTQQKYKSKYSRADVVHVGNVESFVNGFHFILRDLVNRNNWVWHIHFQFSNFMSNLENSSFWLIMLLWNCAEW